VFQKFINHGWNDDGQLKLLVKWFGFPEGEATWQFASSLPHLVKTDSDESYGFLAF